MKLRSLWDVSEIIKDLPRLLGILNTVLKYYRRFMAEVDQDQLKDLKEQYSDFDELLYNLEAIRADVDYIDDHFTSDEL